MNRYLLLLLILLSGWSAQATHLVGGYMNYEYLRTLDNGDFVYKITINVFRDCNQGVVDFDPEIKVGLHLDDAQKSLFKTITIPLGFHRAVVPPGSADCEYFPDQVCLEQGFYEKSVVLKPNPSGYHVTWVRCCRNTQVNLPNGSDGQPNQGQTYYAYIPNPSLENSSPRFSGVPSPFMCARDTNSFLNSAFDPDGDSLAYKIVWPFQGGDITQASAPDPPLNLDLPIDEVVYNPGYSFTRPFGNGGLLTVDVNTGFTQMSAPSPGNYVVAIEVIEYRDGFELSRVRLDLQILVLNCPPNDQPEVDQASRNFTIEAGETVCLDFSGTDPDNDNVTITATGDLLDGRNDFTGTKATFQKRTNQTQVSSQLCWTPDCDQAREQPYSFTVRVDDDGCPPKFDIESFTITVEPFDGSDAIAGPGRACANSIEYNYSAVDPKPNSTFFWSVTNGTIVGPNDQEDIRIKWGSGFAGTIKMVEISEFGCPGDTVRRIITLVPSPDVPLITGPDTICRGDADVAYSVTTVPGETYSWFILGGSGGVITQDNGDNIRTGWLGTGDYTIGVLAVNSDGCTSDTGFINVHVRFPNPLIDGPTSICPNSSGILYLANGERNSQYDWRVTGGSFTNPSSTNRIRVDWGDVGVGTISVREIDRFGCVSDQITLNVTKEYDLDGQVPIGETSVCEGEIEDYFVFESNGSVYDWTVDWGQQISGDSSSEIEVLWDRPGNGRVGVRERAFDAVNNLECISIARYLDVIINPKPTADLIEGTMEVCEGSDSFEYTINGFTGSSFVWKIDGQEGNYQGQGSNTIKITWPADGQFTLSVQELSGDSCLGDVIDTLVIVRPVPEADEIDGPFVVCQDLISNADYSIVGLPNSTFFWTVDSGVINGPNDQDNVNVTWTGDRFGILKVVEISEYGCEGDTVELPIYISAPQLEIEVITVELPDDKILIKWTTGADPLVGGPFVLQRRDAAIEGAWTTITTTSEQSWLDEGLNTDDFIYQYRVTSVDLCGNPIESEPHTHIQIVGDIRTDGFDLDLEFTPYIGWTNGVSNYEVYGKENGREYELIGSFDPESPFILEGEGNSFERCYRVKGYEDSDNGEVTWSNEICFYFSPNVFVPNAFTPNGEPPNDVFNTVTSAITEYQLQIYNRWGERVFETENPEEGWDGTYLNEPAPMGVYMYVVIFSDYQDQSYQKSGTIHLIR